MKKISLLCSVLTLSASFSSHAVRITYMGTEAIYAQSAPVEDANGQIIADGEKEVVGKRNVLKGYCRNGNRVIVQNEGAHWFAVEPREVDGGGSPPADIAFVACGESVPDLSESRASKAEPAKPVFTTSPPAAVPTVKPQAAKVEEKPGAWLR